MSEHYNKEEKKLKYIIFTHVHSVNENLKVHLNVYYRNCKIKNLLIRNSPPKEPEADDHCVYRYTCKEDQCNLFYIGYTQCKLKQSFSGHAQNGSIKKHILQHHPTRKVKKKELLNNVFISYKSNVETNLTLAEASYIHTLKPKINAQSKFCHGTLSLF